MIHIGEKIKQVITDKGFKQKDIAKKLNTTPTNLQNIFKSEDINVKRLADLCKILEYDFFDLYRSSNIANKIQNTKDNRISIELKINDPEQERKIVKLVFGDHFKL